MARASARPALLVVLLALSMCGTALASGSEPLRPFLQLPGRDPSQVARKPVSLSLVGKPQAFRSVGAPDLITGDYYFTIVDLGVAPPGETGTWSRAEAINNDGTVVGSFLAANGYSYRAFVHFGDTMTSIVPPDGDTDSFAFDINNCGVIGGLRGSSAVLWTPPTYGMTTRGSPRVRRIADNGSFIGPTVGNDYLLYPPSGPPIFLGDFSPRAINESGWTCGSKRDPSDGKVKAAIRTPQGQITLVDFSAYVTAPETFFLSEATDINNAGQVTINLTTHYGFRTPPFENKSFIWQNGVLKRIFNIGRKYTYAAAINNLGIVVGHVGIAAAPGYPPMQGVVEYPGGFVGYLQDNISPGSGYYITAATGVNDNGEIVGFGLYPPVVGANDRAYLLRPADNQVSMGPIEGGVRASCVIPTSLVSPLLSIRVNGEEARDVATYDEACQRMAYFTPPPYTGPDFEEVVDGKYVDVTL